MPSLDFSRVDVMDMLGSLGMRNVHRVTGRHGPEARFSCPFPEHLHGDEDPSSFMNLESTAWICFGCGRRGNAIHFLSQFENVSPILAARWLRERYEGGFREPEGSIWEELRKQLEDRSPPPPPGPQPIDEKYLSRYAIDWEEVWRWRAQRPEQIPPPLQYMLDRGFDTRVLEEFEVGFDKDDQRIVLPVRDDIGRLVGFKGRTWHEADERRKYRIMGGPAYGFEPYEFSRIVYGIHRARRSGQLLLVEGELNSMAMHQMGFENVASPGSHILSEEQARIIKYYYDSAVLVYDDVKVATRVAEMLIPLMPVGVVIGHQDDPASHWDRDFWSGAIENAESALLLGISGT